MGVKPLYDILSVSDLRPSRFRPTMEDFVLKIKRKFSKQSNISWPTYILVVSFGLSSWVAVNGIWVELPLLVQHAPEVWKLPSILVVVIQIANIGPILHTIFNVVFPGKLRDATVIYSILVVGIVACALLGFLWDRTGYVSGNEHSVALIVLLFFVAIVDCTSSVTFLPFMAAFREEYMSALFVGYGFSGLLPSLLALGQGIKRRSCSGNNNMSNTSSGAAASSGSDVNFSVHGFFFGIMAMMIVSLLAFVSLNTLPFVQREHVDSLREENGIPREAMPLDHSQEFEMGSLHENNANENDTEATNCQQVDHRVRLLFLLFVLMWINALGNGIIPAIQPYACIPYGYRIYHYTLTLSSIASPLASFLFNWLPTKSLLFVGLSTVVYTSLVGYVLCAAALNSTPPLLEDDIGASIMIVINVISVALVTYTKVTISTWMQRKGERHLRWAGIAMQAGSLFGALVIFFPVNVLDWFTQNLPC